MCSDCTFAAAVTAHLPQVELVGEVLRSGEGDTWRHFCFHAKCLAVLEANEIATHLPVSISAVEELGAACEQEKEGVASKKSPINR
jgi:hypothetical protein